MRRAVLAVLLAATACVSGSTTIGATPGGGVGVVSGRRLGWATKRVATKEAPDTVIAEDGAACRLSHSRFEEVKVGQRLLCDWQPGAPPTDSTRRTPNEMSR